MSPLARFAGIGIIGFLLFPRVSPAQQFTFYFPQVADGVVGGVRYSTTIMLTNTGPDATAKVEFISSAGAPMALVISTLGTGSSFSLTLKKGESVSLRTSGSGTGQVGYCRVTTGASVAGTEVFSGFDAGNTLLFEVGVLATAGQNVFTLFLDTLGGREVGLAYANIGSETANISITQYTQAFASVTAVTRTLPAGQQEAKYIGEILGSKSKNVEGIVTISSDQPLAAVTLRQTGSAFTAFPVIPRSADECWTRGSATRNPFSQIDSISPTTASKGAKDLKAVILGAAAGGDSRTFYNLLPLPNKPIPDSLCDFTVTFLNPGIRASVILPTAAMRMGDFSAWGEVIDPLTGKPFPANILPASRLFSVVTLPLLVTVDPAVPAGNYGFTVAVEGDVVTSGTLRLAVK